MLEEEVLDTHKLVMDNTTKFLNDAHSVFSATHEVDYDQEGTTNLFLFALLFTFFYWFSVTALISYTILCWTVHFCEERNTQFRRVSSMCHRSMSSFFSRKIFKYEKLYI